MRLLFKQFLLLSVMLLATSAAFPSAFQLIEQNAVNAGNFGAGAAAEAGDASIGFFNAAGLTQIKKIQFVGAGTLAFVSSRFSGESIWRSNSILLPPGFSYTESGQASGGVTTLVPAMHIAVPVNEHWYLGFGVTVPFGLETNYGEHSVLRYAATDSFLETINFSPSLAYLVNEHLSVGGGFDAQYIDARFNSIAGFPVDPGDPTNADSPALNSGDGWGYGWHAGVLVSFKRTRLGLSYRSSIAHSIRGSSSFTGPLAPDMIPVLSNNLRANIRLPSTTIFSIYHDINDDWAVMGSAYYTHWSVFDSIVLRNVAGIDSMGAADNQVIVVAPQNFANTWHLAAGVNYRVNRIWLLRAGLGYDQSPTNDVDRNARLPDEDRFVLAVGTQIAPWKHVRFDFGYSHIFVRDADIANTTINGSEIVRIEGRSRNHADLLAGQVTISFG